MLNVSYEERAARTLIQRNKPKLKNRTLGDSIAINSNSSVTSTLLRDILNVRMTEEKFLPAIVHFTVYIEGGQIKSQDWFDNISTDHANLSTAIQFCVDGLTEDRQNYESVRVNVNGDLDGPIDIEHDWTDIVFSSEPITAVNAFNAYMIRADGIEHIRIKGANLDYDYTNQTNGGGIKFDRCRNVYVSDCRLIRAYSEGIEYKTCINAYIERCFADDFGDDGFSILDCAYILIKKCHADNGRNQAGVGGSGCFEFEDGTHHSVVEDSLTTNSAAEGIHIILDGAKELALSAIQEIGNGVYRAITTGATSLSIGKTAKILNAVGTGDHDGIWPVVLVDFNVGQYFEFDMGPSNAGIVDSVTNSDSAEFSHGVCHDIHVLNHDINSVAGKGVTITSNGVTYEDPSIPLFTYNIFIDGLRTRNLVGGAAIETSFAHNIEIRNVDHIGIGFLDTYGVSFSNTKGIRMFDSDIRHCGDSGVRGYRILDAEFYRVKSNDNSEHTTSNFGFGFVLDCNQFNFDNPVDAPIDQDGGFILQDCEATKVNWLGTGSADYRAGIRLDDCSNTQVLRGVYTAFSGSATASYTGGASAANTTYTNVIAFEQA